MSVKFRNCIICDSNNNITIFEFSRIYTETFKNNNLRQRELNNKYGPHRIAKCNICGCKYVPNVIEGISQNSNISNVFESQNRNIQITKQNKNFFIKEKDKFEDPINKLKLMKFISKKRFNDLSILDYGSGSGRISKLSELLGFKKIVAYDPVYNKESIKKFKVSDFKKIKVVNNINQLSKNEKFDIIWCTAVIEHAFSVKDVFIDLKKFSKLSSIILISNPIMNIEKDLNNLLNLNKQKRLLHFHLGHINYMLGRDFNKLLNMYGFKIIPINPSYNSNQKIISLIKKIIVKILPKISRSEYLIKLNN